MRCDVGTCSREATVLIHFRSSVTPYAYCQWHSHGPRGEVRWSKVLVRAVETLP